MLVLACEAQPTATRSRTEATDRTPVESSPAAPAPIDPTIAARATELTSRFRGGKTCDVGALAELRELRRSHGVAAVADALRVAFTTCGETDALASLAAETLPEGASDEQRLAVGAALIRAARYDEAVALLLPLASAAGAGTRAEWLAGFALFHAGRSEEALPMLERARAFAPGDGGDAFLLIGLGRLHAGDVEGAITELEAAREKAPSPSSWSALARAYAAAGRDDEAKQATLQGLAVRVAAAEREGVQARLAAMSNEVDAAVGAARYADADALLERMLTIAPDDVRPKLVATREQIQRMATADGGAP